MARSDGGYSFDDVAAEIATGRMQLWPAPDACAVTQIIGFPQKTFLHIFLAGGNMGRLKDMIESAAEWGRSQGCAAMTMTGRKGWARVLDWRVTSITMEKEL